MKKFGLTIEPSTFDLVKSYIHNQSIRDVWIARKDLNLEDLVLSKDKVIDAKFVHIGEFTRMLENKEIIDSLSYFVEVYNNIGK